MGSATGTATPKKPALARTSAGSTLRMTIVLALLLAAVGVAGAGALKLLVHAMRPPTADDTAQLICTAFQRQDYTLLIQQIDTTPVPPAASSPLNGTALRAQLTGLDSSDGTVTSCKYVKIGTSDTPAQYSFTLQRAHAATLTSLVVYLVREADGSWKIRSDSELANPPN